MRVISLLKEISLIRPNIWLRTGLRSNSPKEPDYYILKGFPGWYSYNEILSSLSEAGMHGAIVDLGVQTRSIDEYAMTLKKFLPKDREFTLIGFSMGGLIALKYADNTNWKNIKKVITVATPFGGSPKAAYLPFWKATHQMREGSEYLDQFQKMKLPRNKLLCAYGEDDDLVNNEHTHLGECLHEKIPEQRHVTTQLYFQKHIQHILEKHL